MSAGNVAVACAAWFTLAIVQLLTALVSPGMAITGAAGVGLLVFGLARFFSLEFENLWTPVWIAASASAAAIAICFLAGLAQATWTLWFGPPLSALVAALIAFGQNRSRVRCELCYRRIGAREVAFRCPRCGLRVCDTPECWVHERLRCRLCEQNQVPVLPADKRWWDRQFGPRVGQGRCQLTLEDASAADLRACPRCGRLQSTTAWDLNNGQCVRCQWVLDDLPETLRAYLLPADPRQPEESSPRHGRRRRPHSR